MNDKTEWQMSRNHFGDVNLEIPIAHVEFKEVRVRK